VCDRLYISIATGLGHPGHTPIGWIVVGIHWLTCLDFINPLGLTWLNIQVSELSGSVVVTWLQCWYTYMCVHACVFIIHQIQGWSILFYHYKHGVWKLLCHRAVYTRKTIIHVCLNVVSLMTLFFTYSHQSARGYYRVSAFFLTKVFCDLLPMRIVPVIFYSAISYWMLGE